MAIKRVGLLFLITLTAVGAFASTVSFVGPVYPKDQGVGKREGTVCNISDPTCILGEPELFEVFGAQLTATPMGAMTQFTLTIQTNYGLQASHLIPRSPDVVPNYALPGLSAFSIGDFLIVSGGVDYAVVLHPHDGYAAGSLYTASGFQTADTATMGQIRLNLNHNVLLAGGGTRVGNAGTLTGAETGNGASAAQFTLTDTFSAPAGFLSPGTPFSIDFSSYVCGNGVVEGSSGGFTQGTGGGNTPEPGTFLLMAPILALAGLRRLLRPQSSH